MLLLNGQELSASENCPEQYKVFILLFGCLSLSIFGFIIWYWSAFFTGHGKHSMPAFVPWTPLFLNDEASILSIKRALSHWPWMSGQARGHCQHGGTAPWKIYRYLETRKRAGYFLENTRIQFFLQFFWGKWKTSCKFYRLFAKSLYDGNCANISSHHRSKCAYTTIAIISNNRICDDFYIA